jgi:hypothetical protein
MPRGGAYTVSDLPRDRLCRIACERCGRAGAYWPETLAARFGDAALPARARLVALTACPRRGDYSRPCGAGYVGPPPGAVRREPSPAGLFLC